MHKICVDVSALRRSVSFYGAVNWNLTHRQNVSFRASPQTGVGISIEFQAAQRHTGRSILPFPGIHPREIVLLSGRLPRQCELLYRNDREFVKFQFRDQLTKRRSPDSCFFLFFYAFPFLANKSGFLPEKGGILLRDLNSSGRKLSFLLIIFKKSLQSERYVIYYCDQAMVFTK